MSNPLSTLKSKLKEKLELEKEQEIEKYKQNLLLQANDIYQKITLAQQQDQKNIIIQIKDCLYPENINLLSEQGFRIKILNSICLTSYPPKYIQDIKIEWDE